MEYLGKLSDGKDVATKEYADHYGVCATAAAAQAKTVTIPGVTALQEGVTIRVKMTNNQTYNGVPTLNVNSLGAKNIQRVGGTNAARYEWMAGEILALTYDGTYWVIIDGGIATTTYYGATKLYTGAASTSTALALTPSALNSFAQNVVSGYPVYSTSATYAVGDRVRYSTSVYECIVAITTGEAWTAAHWKEVDDLQTQIDDLKSSVSSGKALIAAAVTDKGVETAATDSFQTMANNIEAIPSGGGVTVEPLSVTANGTYNAPTGKAYSPVTVNVSGGGGGGASKNDVNFYDYDGTIVTSYSAADFANLTALPANPTHSGLTAQGWNWTLANAKTYVASYGELNIGQMYTTSDGKTRIYIHLEDGRLAPYLGIAINGTATVYWGDGSTSTVTGTSTNTVVNTQHTYAAAGDYVIAIAVTGSMALVGSSSYGSQILWKNNTTGNLNRAYQSAIQKVEIGSNTSIHDYAFYSCYSLTSVTIPSSVTSISNNAFSSCYSLASVTIPSTVTSIGTYTFNNCYSLASVTIPSTVTSIEQYTFGYCYSLTSVTIPSGVTSISNNAFRNCYSLTSVTIPSTVTSIGNNAFYSCYSLTSVTIPSTVTSISNNAFYSCYSLTSVTIPSSVTSIGDYVFSSCYSLASVTIPSTVTSIGTWAFSSCYSLASVTIPSTVTSISNNAFYSCYGLGFIKFASTTPPTVSNSNAWTSIPIDCIIYVPSASLDTYKSATNYPSSRTYTYVGY